MKKQHGGVSQLRNQLKECQSRIQNLSDKLERKKQLALDLRTEKNKYRRIFNSCRQGIIIHDFNLDILEVNTKAARLLGYKKSDCKNLSMKDIISDGKVSYIPDLIEKLKKTTTIRYETVFQKRNGKNFEAEVHANRLSWEGQEVVLSIFQDATQNRKSEPSLQNAYKTLHSIVRSVPDIIYRLDTKARIVFVNEAVREYGYSPKELIGRNIFDLVHPEDREKAQWRVNERRTGERRTTSFEIRLKTKKQKTILFDVHASQLSMEPVFLLDSEGLYGSEFPSSESFLGSQGVARDITARKITEKILQESEEKFRSIVENSHVGIGIIDDRFKFVYVNDRFLKIVGYSRKEIIGKDFRKFLKSEDASLIKQRYLERQKGQRVPAKYEFSIKNKTGHQLTLEIIASVVTGSNGKIRTIFQLLDITENKKAQKALQESERKFRQLFQNANDAIYLWELNRQDRPTRCLEVNDKACEMLGYTRDELIRKTLRNINSKESANDIPAVMQVLRKKSHHTFQMTHLAKDGREIPVEISAHIYNLDGKQVLLSITRDITERKRAEHALKASEEKLRTVINFAPVVLWAVDQKGIFTFSQGRGLEPLGLKPGEVVGRSVQDIYKNNKQIQSDIQRALKGEAFHSMVVENGIVFDSRMAPIVDDKGQITGVTGVAMDITDRQKTEQALQTKSSEQEKLLETARHLTESLDLKDVLTRIAREAKTILNAHGCTIYILEPDHQTLTPMVSIDPNYKDEILATPIMVDNSFTGKAIQSRKGRIFNEAENDDTGYQIPGTPEDEEENIIVAPFILDSKVLGAMCLDRKKMIFTEDDLSLTETFATYATTAIKNAKAHQSLQKEVEERRQAQRALKDSEEKFRNLAEQSPNMIFINLDGNVVYANKKCEEMMGYTREEFYQTGFNFMDLIAPESRELIESNFIKHSRGEEIRPYEYTLISKSGERIDVLITTKLIHYENKKAILGIITDIGLQKRAEEALRLSEEKYRKFFEDDLTGDFIATATGKLLACNSAYLRIFGFNSEEEAYNWDISHFFPSPPDYDRLLDKIRKEKILEYHEMELRRSDSKPVNVIANMIGKFDDQQNLAEIIGYFFDDTERKILEQQFRQAQKMEAVGRLAGGVAHDFNNLLTIISGYSDLLLHRLNRDDSMTNDIRQIKQAGQKATRLTNQLLAFSRRQVMQPRFINLNSVVTDVEKILRRLIGEDIELMINLDNDLANIKADPGQLEQVLMNLAVNARDAMPDGGKLVIETEMAVLEKDYYHKHIPVQPAGEYVLLTLSDNGLGMDEETQAQIFEPFFTTKARGKGTGLGLSTVYGIIKQSEGFIWVNSKPNEGTTFRIYFPPVEYREQKRRAAEKRQKSYQGNETILLVEDETMVRELAFRILKENGYKVLESTRGDQAVSISERYDGRIDLMVTDVVMPGISGKELAIRLKKTRPDMKVLFISGYSDEVINQKEKIDEHTDFLQKPFLPVKFLEAVRHILDNKKVKSPS